MKKYELISTTETTYSFERRCEIPLFRVRCCKSFYDLQEFLVEEGSLGGFVESENNLSQSGNCWIYDNAKVIDNAVVSEDAVIDGKAFICGSASVKGAAHIDGKVTVSDNAVIMGGADIFGYDLNHCTTSEISGNAVVKDAVSIEGEGFEITDNAVISGSSYIGDFAKIKGHTVIKDSARVKGYAQVLDNSIVGGESVISGHAVVSGNSKLTEAAFLGDNCRTFGNAAVSSNNDIFCVSAIEKGGSNVTFFKTSENNINVSYSQKEFSMSEFKTFLKTVENSHSQETLLKLTEVAQSYLKPQLKQTAAVRKAKPLTR